MTTQSRIALHYYPVFFAKIACTSIGLIISQGNSGLEINFLLNLNLLSIIAYGIMRSHNRRLRRNLEFCNMSGIMVMSYMTMGMTHFNLDPHKIMLAGYFWIANLIILIVVNLLYFVIIIWESYVHDKRLKYLKKY